MRGGLARPARRRAQEQGREQQHRRANSRSDPATVLLHAPCRFTAAAAEKRSGAVSTASGPGLTSSDIFSSEQEGTRTGRPELGVRASVRNAGKLQVRSHACLNPPRPRARAPRSAAIQIQSARDTMRQAPRAVATSSSLRRRPPRGSAAAIPCRRAPAGPRRGRAGPSSPGRPRPASCRPRLRNCPRAHRTTRPVAPGSRRARRGRARAQLPRSPCMRGTPWRAASNAARRRSMSLTR